MHQQVFVAASVVLLAVWHALGDMPCLHCAHVKYQQACTAACIVFSAVECTWKQCMHQQALNVAAKGFARLFDCRTAVYIQKRQALHFRSAALISCNIVHAHAKSARHMPTAGMQFADMNQHVGTLQYVLQIDSQILSPLCDVHTAMCTVQRRQTATLMKSSSMPPAEVHKTSTMRCCTK